MFFLLLLINILLISKKKGLSYNSEYKPLVLNTIYDKYCIYI